MAIAMVATITHNSTTPDDGVSTTTLLSLVPSACVLVYRSSLRIFIQTPPPDILVNPLRARLSRCNASVLQKEQLFAWWLKTAFVLDN